MPCTGSSKACTWTTLPIFPLMPCNDSSCPATKLHVTILRSQGRAPRQLLAIWRQGRAPGGSCILGAACRSTASAKGTQHCAQQAWLQLQECASAEACAVNGQDVASHPAEPISRTVKASDLPLLPWPSAVADAAAICHRHTIAKPGDYLARATTLPMGKAALRKPGHKPNVDHSCSSLS